MKRSRSSQVVASIMVNAVYEMKNYPINLVNTVLSPLSFLVVIDFVSKGALIGQAIEGGLIMSMFQSGMSLQGDISHLKNDFKLQDMLVSSPASPAAYVVGMAASEIIYNLPALGILIALGAIYIHPGAFQALELTGGPRSSCFSHPSPSGSCSRRSRATSSRASPCRGSSPRSSPP